MQGVPLAAVIASVLATGLACADVTYVSQSRFVLADRVGVPGTDIVIAAPDFGAFDQTADLPLSMEQCDAVAHQVSSLLPSVLTASHHCRASDGIQVYTGDADSVLDVELTLAEPTFYVLTGTWSIFPPGVFQPVNRVTLTRIPDTVLFESKHVPGGAGTDTFRFSGTLGPGQYRVYTEARPLPPTTAGTGSYYHADSALTLEFLECPADLTVDGLVDFADYLEFLNRYDAQDARVDFNSDGQLDFADFLEFLNLYDAGC